MTDYGEPSVDYFDLKFRETVRTPEEGYVQKFESKSDRGFTVLYRHSRYGRPESILHAASEPDADQVLLEAENRGVEHVLESKNKKNGGLDEQ